MRKSNYDVVILGAGPKGRVAAADLSGIPGDDSARKALKILSEEKPLK